MELRLFGELLRHVCLLTGVTQGGNPRKQETSAWWHEETSTQTLYPLKATLGLDRTVKANCFSTLDTDQRHATNREAFTHGSY